MMPFPLDYLFVGALGLAIGSFLNVCIWRLPRLVTDVEDGAADAAGEEGSVAGWLLDVGRQLGRAVRHLSSPPSSCPACGTPIAWYHNVPILSWVALGGRCAACRAPISARYPLVEAGTALLFVLHLAVLGWGPLVFVRLAFAAALVVLFAIDLEHQLLPDVITVPGTVLGLAASAFLPPGFAAAAAGAVLGGGLLWAVAEGYYRWRRVEGLGFGDVKMLAMVGAFLGWKGTLVTLLFGSLSGAAVGVALIASGRGTMGLKLPFGTFLAVAAVLASLWGESLAAWYLSLYP